MTNRSEHHETRIAAHVEATERLELDTDLARVLAIGSQLVHGSVGLNAAEAVYAAGGVRVARVPSILLSVMPHYASFHHLDVTESWITQSLEDLDRIAALDAIEIVTVGYLASPAQAEAIASWVRRARDRSRAGTRPTFVLDPTLGDTEVGFITHPALTGAVRDYLAPIATGITPNLFELALLTCSDEAVIDSREAAEDAEVGAAAAALAASFVGDSSEVHDRIAEAARSLLSDHTEWVCVTGVNFADDQIGVVLVTAEGVSAHPHERVATDAKGLGDTFAAAMNVALIGAGAEASLTPRRLLETAVERATTAVLARISRR